MKIELSGLLKLRNLMFLCFGIVCLCVLTFNCTHISYGITEKDTKALKELWQNSKSSATRKAIIHELENRKAVDVLIFCLNYVTTFPTISGKWPKSGLEDCLSIIEAIERLKSPEAIEALQYATRSRMRTRELKLAVLSAYREIADPRAALPATELLSDSDYEIRWQALSTLGHLKNPDSREAIYPLLFDMNSNMRMNAVHALGEIGHPDAIDRISLLLSDKDVSVREAAEAALKKLAVSEKNIIKWKRKAAELDRSFSIEDLYRSKIDYEKVVQEKKILQQKLESEADVKHYIESILKSRRDVLEKQKELTESLYEKERQLKSKNTQLDLAKHELKEYRKQLDILDKKAKSMKIKVLQTKTKKSSAGLNEDLDKILQLKSDLTHEAESLKKKELKLSKEVSNLTTIAERKRLEAQNAKNELALMRKRETKLLGQMGELKNRLKRKMAPVLVVSKPLLNTTIQSPTTMLHFIAVDDKGIKRVNVSLNGNQVKIEKTRGIKIVEDKSSYISKKIDIIQRLKLKFGQNTIRVRVVDTDGLICEELIRVERIKEKGNIWAAVIGINEYKNTRNLKYAVSDASAFNSYIKEYIGIPEKNISFLIDRDATRENIQSLLGTQLKRKAAKNDTVIIFYAGHGAVETDPSNPDGDGFEKYLLPYDSDLNDLYTTAISMDEIKKIFLRIRAERLIFIADTCYSGASGGRTTLSTRTRANLSDKFFNRISKGKGRVIISSSSANEISKEDDKLRHGIFSYYLLEGLKGKADQDDDGIINISELFGYISRKVPKASGQDQHPVKKGEIEGELVIGRIK